MFLAIFNDVTKCYLCLNEQNTPYVTDRWVAKPNKKFATKFSNRQAALRAIKEFYMFRFGKKPKSPVLAVDQFGFYNFAIEEYEDE